MPIWRPCGRMGTCPTPCSALRDGFPRRLRPISVHRHPHPGDGRRGMRPGNGYHGRRGRELVRTRPVSMSDPAARTPVRAPGPDEEVRVSDETPEQSPSRRPVHLTHRTAARAAQRRRVRRLRDPGARGSRGGPQAPGHVHRLDRRARAAPPDLGDRQQRRRRVAGRLLRPGRGHPAGRRRRPRRGQRPRHPDRHRARPGAAGRDDGADRAPRRRQVRWRRLQGLRRPARRRRQRGQRARRAGSSSR